MNDSGGKTPIKCTNDPGLVHEHSIRGLRACTRIAHPQRGSVQANWLRHGKLVTPSMFTCVVGISLSFSSFLLSSLCQCAPVCLADDISVDFPNWYERPVVARHGIAGLKDSDSWPGGFPGKVPGKFAGMVQGGSQMRLPERWGGASQNLRFGGRRPDPCLLFSKRFSAVGRVRFTHIININRSEHSEHGEHVNSPKSTTKPT